MLTPELRFCRNAKYLSLLQSIYNICKHQLQQIFIKSVILKIVFMIITGCCCLTGAQVCGAVYRHYIHCCTTTGSCNSASVSGTKITNVLLYKFTCMGQMNQLYIQSRWRLASFTGYSIHAGIYCSMQEHIGVYRDVL